VIAILLAIGSAVWTFERFARIETEVTRRLQGVEQRDAGFESSLKHAQDLLRDVQNRGAVLESKVAETAGLQAQLEKLYRDRAEDSLDALLAEVEASLTLSAQQLSLGADPQAVLVAMEDLDSRLARQNDARLGPVRAALQRDIERLRVYPSTDVSSLALRIDALVGALDQLPLLASLEEPAHGASGVVAADSPKSGEGQPGAPAASAPPQTGGRVAATLAALGSELQDLFRVRKIDSPDALLVSPKQAYFLRQNLRLMLLNARLALLSRSDAVYRSDLERARRWIDTYYDGEQRNVIAVQAQLRQLLDTKLVLEPLRIDDSLAAVRLARTTVR
jgi:uroporphyrin-3 C-methyltransferase/uroporphyrinogen III methyltransferase/synthase